MSLFDHVFSNVESYSSHTAGSIKLFVGAILGSVFGFILLILSTIITFIVIIGVCACNHHCLLYKWRHRREHPPVGVIIADVNMHGNFMEHAELQLQDSNQVNEENSIGRNS